MTETDAYVAIQYMKRGYKNIANYVAKYGRKNMDPAFYEPTTYWEKFYGKCLEEGHPWSHYHKYSGDEIF